MGTGTNQSEADFQWDAGDSLGEWMHQWRKELDEGAPLSLPHEGGVA